MIKTALNAGVAAGWVTFLTTTDVIAILGGIVGIVFTILRIITWFDDRKRRRLYEQKANLEINILELKKEQALKELKNTPHE